MRVKSALREPLLHFLAIGAALFLYFHWSGGGSGPASSRIVLTAGQIEHLAAGFTKTWQHPPTDAEMKGLIDEWVREEIAVREAMAMGLDLDDTVIRRRLRQKVEFLVEDVAGEAAAPPTDAELQAFLDQHADGFRIEPRVSFRQVHVSRERRGAGGAADAVALLARLKAAGSRARIDELGDSLMLPQEVELSPMSDVARVFGGGFAGGIATMPPGTWAGPVESGYGLHLVLVRERVEGAAADLAAVRPDVERGFLAARRARQLAAMYERLLEKYTVVIEPRTAAAADDGAVKDGP